jgi:hypothetical protein
MSVNLYILRYKSSVHRWEGVAKRYEEELKQLDPTIKEEGLFCVKWCLVVSVSTINFHYYPACTHVQQG